MRRRSFHIGLLVAALSACGSEEAKDIPPLCYEDSDCSRGKFCGYDSNYGAERCLGTGSSNGEGGNGGSGNTGGSASLPSDACGNSPLNGKYLWNVGNCESGAITPGDPETCTFQFRAEDDEIFLIHYRGLELGPNKLVREIAYSDLMPYEEDVCSHGAASGDSEDVRAAVDRSNCILSLDSNLFVLVGQRTCLTNNLDIIMPEPYTNTPSCRSHPEIRAIADAYEQRCR